LAVVSWTTTSRGRQETAGETLGNGESGGGEASGLDESDGTGESEGSGVGGGDEELDSAGEPEGGGEVLAELVGVGEAEGREDGDGDGEPLGKSLGEAGATGWGSGQFCGLQSCHEVLAGQPAPAPAGCCRTCATYSWEPPPQETEQSPCGAQLPTMQSRLEQSLPYQLASQEHEQSPMLHRPCAHPHVDANCWQNLQVLVPMHQWPMLQKLQSKPQRSQLWG
jgi:hypothetical protein